MTVQGFVNLLGIELGFVAGLFFCLGSSEIKKTDIVNMSATYIEENPYSKVFLINLKADYRCGALALILAFIAQFVAAILGDLPTVQLFETSLLGAVSSLLLAAIGSGLLWGYRRRVVCVLSHTRS